MSRAHCYVSHADQEASNSHLRIVHNVGGISKEASGPTYSVVRLCDSLIASGAELTLTSIDWKLGQNGPSYNKSFPPGCGPRRLGRSPGMYRWISAQARAGAIDLIHSHGLWLMTNVYPGWVARRHGIPLVISPRGTFTRYAMSSGSRVKLLFWPLVQRPALAPTVCFHATGEAEYDDIRRLGFEQPVAIIPNGIDLPPVAPRQYGERRTLLFLGRIHPNKGLDMLLPAWARLQDRFPNWDLRIIGNDHGYHGVSGYLEEMKTLAQRLEVTRVGFEGPHYGGDKLNAFREADLFVLPTYSENFGMTVAESLSQETPVIVTKGAPWQGLVSNRAGWWIDIGLEPLTAALEDALTRTQDQLESMGKRGRVWMRDEFKWTKVAGELSAVYRWLRDPSVQRPSSVRLENDRGLSK